MNTLATTFQMLATAETESATASPFSLLIPIVLVGGLFYLFILMPQRRRQKKSREMQASIGIGDEIRTIGGIVGTIVGQDDQTFTLDLGASTMRVIKRAVAERMEAEPTMDDRE